MRYAQVDRVRRTVRGGRTGDVWTLAEEGVSGLPVPAHRLGALLEG